MPRNAVGKYQSKRSSDQHADSISVDCHGGSESKFVIGQYFPPIGVNHDVLACAEKRNHDSEQRHHPRILSGRNKR